MKKIIPLIVEKTWGKEKWLYSPLKKSQTKDENGNGVLGGPLIKILDSKKPLPVQVHPDDLLAKKMENELNGKSESWFIIDCKKDAEATIGLKNYEDKFIKDSIKKGNFEENLLKINVKPNDFINVPAGMVHGLGANIKAFEVQQPSDITYRYYDYGRLVNGKPREMQIEKSILCQKDIDWRLKPIRTNPLTYKTDVGYQIFINKKSVLEKDAIVIDLVEEFAYICKSGEEINFKNYVIIY